MSFNSFEDKKKFNNNFQDDTDIDFNFVYGRVPVMELLKSETTIDKILISNSEGKGSILKIIAMAKEKGILIKNVSPEKLDKISKKSNHQGVIAFIASYRYSELDDIFKLAKQKNQMPFVVILDEIEDPHNMGAIVRTAEAAGVHGIIIPKRRSVGLTPTVMKVSAGAASYIPIVRVPNLVNVIKNLKDNGFWIYCLESGGSSCFEFDYSGPVAVIVGSEGKGVSRIIKENSDFVVSLPMMGRINSLNASVAVGIFMYEIVKYRNIKYTKN